MIPFILKAVIGITLLWLFIVLIIRYVSPKDVICKGRKIRIYVDGELNREATITGVCSDYVTVYEKLPLPVHYRGNFYAIGRMSDGHTIMFLGKKKLYTLMRFTELIRKIANIPEYMNQLPKEDQDPETVDVEEEVEDEL